MIHIVALIATETVVELIYDRDLTPGLKNALASNHAGGDVNALYFYTLTAPEESRVRANDEYTITWVDSAITGLDFSAEDSKPYMRYEISRDTVKSDAPADLALTGIGVWEAGTYNQGDHAYRNNNIWQCTATTTTETPSNSASDWTKICSALQLTLTALQSDNVTVLTSFNQTVLVPIYDNDSRTIPLLCPFTDGVCDIVLAFKAISECGTWYFPNSTDEIDAVNVTTQAVTAINVDPQITVDVILPF